MSSTVGKYRLERELGRGGMGVVREAFDPQLQRRVAIKLMHSGNTASASRLALFEREARAVARLQTPHVVHIYDYGVTEEGWPYMVMELLEGESLAQRLQRSKTMTPAALLPILTQVAKGLDAAHVAGIIHRDLKPGNIFLAQHGTEVMTKLLDFGIATMHSAPQIERAEQHQLAGTPPYMSPEQVRSEPLDHRTDLWSLGVVAYEALTGGLPFQGDTLAGMLMRICKDPVRPASSLVPGLGPALDVFFERALAKDPGERFSSARDLVAAFARMIPEEDTRPAKILVVDDEPDLPLLIEQCFWQQVEDGRYTFVFAGNGIEALQALCENPDVDIALTDLRMPGMDGLTLLGKLGEAAPALRAIVISAYSDMYNVRQAMNSGAFDFLIKPLDFVDLENTIEKAVREAAKLRRALQSMEENESLRMFVDPTVRERLLPLLRISGDMAGERIDATVALIRIPGHQRHADNPRGAVEHLNHTYDDLMPVLDAHRGAVTRFLGDAVLATFRGDGHRERAVAASLEVRIQLRTARARAPRASGPRIGIASGQVVTGSVGAPSKRRFDYAVFGEPVDIAHELESLARPGQILIDETLGKALGARFQCERTGKQVMDDAGRWRVVLDVVSVRERAADASRGVRTVSFDQEETLAGRKPNAY